MPVAEAFAMSQLERLAEFPGAPENPQAFHDRAAFLAELSRDNEHCRAIVNRLHATREYFPLPVDIETAAEEERRASEPEWAGHAARCEECHDTGWRISGTGVVRCQCQATKAAAKPRAPTEPQENWPVHPEIAQGIPAGIVTGKNYAAREKVTKSLGWYDGPLTLGEAVDLGMLTRDTARQRVEAWEEATGQTFRVVEAERALVKRPASVPAPLKQKSPEVA